jgi:predicted MFS family arabinose efflux permease
MTARSAAVTLEIFVAAFALLVGFSALAWILLRVRLSGALRGLAKLEGLPELLRSKAGGEAAVIVDTTRFGFLRGEFESLYAQLRRASTCYAEAYSCLTALGGNKQEPNGLSATLLASIPETTLARSFARRLTSLVALLIVLSTFALGGFTFQRIEQSFTPEFDRRTELVGTVANASIERTVSAGVPIASLVGGKEYFEHLKRDFPEISYFAIVTDRPLVEVGTKAARPGAIFPIRIDGKEIGSIVTQTDPEYLVRQFRNVVLDLGVIVLVIVLFAFELIVVTMSLSLTGPFDRLIHLAELQAAGDFSKRLSRTTHNVIDRVAVVLSERAETLQALYVAVAAAISGGASDTGAADALAVIGERYRLRGPRPEIVRLCTLTDVRLALFLFGVADELPLSFFSLYVRSADNPLTWLNPGLAISLPLSAYLVGALIAGAMARPLAMRFGHCNVFLIGAALMIAAYVGYFFAANIIEIILCSAFSGTAFVLSSLACQDHVIDLLAAGERARASGLVATALFGGIFAGTAIGGVLADRIGGRPVFLVAAAVVVISALLVLRLLPRGRVGTARAAGAGEAFSLNILRPLRSWRFAALAFGVVVPLAIVDQAFITYLLALAMDSLGASLADIGRVMMVFFLALIVSGATYAKLPPRRAAPTPAAFVALLVAGLALMVAVIWPSQWSFLIAAIGGGIGHGLSRGPQNALTIDLAEGALAHLGPTAVFGAVRVLERGGSVLGLLCVGYLTSIVGYVGATGVIALTLLGGAVLFFSQRVGGRAVLIAEGTNA